MVLGIIVGLAGLVFLIWGILYNQKTHKEDGISSGVIGGDSIIADLFLFAILWVVDKFPFWVAKILLFVAAIFCFYGSYQLFTN